MEELYIFGHKKPDTDSVVSAIALANLKNELGLNANPYVLGKLNTETRFILEKFKVKEPNYLHDIRLEIKNLDYKKDIFQKENNSIYDTYYYLYNNNISTMPIVNSKNVFIGAVSTKDILKSLVRSSLEELHTNFDNIIKAIDGTPLVKINDEFNGVIDTSKNDIDHVLIKDCEVEFNKFTKLIIICGNYPSVEYITKCKENKINLIYTKQDILNTCKNIHLANYIKTIINENIITVDEHLEVDDFLKLADKHKRTNYPVINQDNECLGVLSLSDINNKNKKKVILVDHNEFAQSADGIEQADIIEIIDHHKIGIPSTTNPINFRNIPVGSTSTIIYNMYKEYGIKLNKTMAGLLLSGIISDTLNLKSPTSTNIDKQAINDLAKLSKLNVEEFANEIFKARSILENNIEDIIYDDFKSFKIDNMLVGIAQITTTDYSQVLERVTEINDTISKIKEYDLFLLVVTDLINDGSYIYYREENKDIVSKAFDIKEAKQGIFVNKLLSRKKQIVPAIYKALEK